MLNEMSQTDQIRSVEVSLAARVNGAAILVQKVKALGQRLAVSPQSKYTKCLVGLTEEERKFVDRSNLARVI